MDIYIRINQQFMNSEKDCNILKRETLYDIWPFISYISHTFLGNLNIHKWNPCWRLHKHLSYAVLVQNSLKERYVLWPAIFNISLEMPLGTAKTVKARLLQLNWDTAELSRLSRHVYCNWSGTQRNCQDCRGTSIAIELGHSGIVKIDKVRLLQLNWDTAELSRLTRYVYCNSIGTQRNCQDWQGTSIAIELGHSGIVKIDKVRLLQLNWDTAELSRLSM